MADATEVRADEMTWIRNSRLLLGRSLINCGIAVLPPGKVKRDLTVLIGQWGSVVYNEVMLGVLRREGKAALDEMIRELERRGELRLGETVAHVVPKEPTP